MKSVNTRTRYKIVGSDYSGQELRLAAYLSQDETLLKAYAEGKDAYSMIASMIFDIPYSDCCEFYAEGQEIEVDGKKIIAGSDKTYNIDVDDTTGFTTAYYNLIQTQLGERAAKDINVGDKVQTDIGWLTVKTKQVIDNININFILD